MTYPNHPCVEVLGSQEVRNAVMKALAAYMYEVGPEWKRLLAASSLTLTSPCGKRIIKIDNCKVYTMDNKKPDGSWMSVKFTCKTVEEAWSMAKQAIVAFDNKRSRAVLH